MFRAVCKFGTVFTDDYNDEEIKKELHIKHIIEDFKRNFTESFWVHIYDENDNKIKDVFVMN